MSDDIKKTTHQPFCKTDSAPLLAVNAGVPVEEALELSTELMRYVELLAAADALIDKTAESAVIQHLSEMAKALNKACGYGAVVADNA